MPTTVIDAEAPLVPLRTLLGGVAGIQTTYLGTPESSSRQVMGYVAFLGADVVDRAAGGLFRATLRYFVGIGYRVGGDQAAAESTMAQASTDFVMAFYGNRQAGTLLAGTVDSMALVANQSTEPIYLTLAAQEFRVVPHIVEVTQQQSIALP